VNNKTACLLLSLCPIGSAVALGLGDISVRSNLGQPLHATVALLGATPTTSADCFSLSASPASITPPLHAKLSLDKIAGQTLLHIRTTEAVYDPIAQFVLVSDCESRLQREYAVLLDPPSSSVAPAVSDDAPTKQAAAAPAAPRAVRRTPRVKHTAAAALPLATDGDSAPAPRTHRAAPAKPRLVLSGKHTMPSADVHLSLRYDTNLPDLSRPHPDALTATELSDENTALTRKLAHLETQLTALQQRNAQLEAPRTGAPAKAATSTPSSNKPSQWPLYLLGAGLLAASALLVAWLRRRNRDRQTTAIFPDELAWAPHPDALPALPDTGSAPVAVPTRAPAAGSSAPAAPPPQRMADIPPPPLLELGTELKEDILDQAEVFMAHGHGELAISLLQEHLREAPTESPVPWLLLLDLLYRDGDKVGYATASAECRRYFNVNLSGYPVSQDSDIGQGLEAYPHLLEQLEKVWNSPGIDAFFDDLIYDKRGGTRMGFEPSAYRDILLLRAIAHDTLPLTA
jgi:hypothetical protein